MSSVLVIGTYRQTLTVIRSLARAGQKVILGVSGDAATCDYSRYVSELWHYPDPSLAEGDFFRALTDLLRDRDDIHAIIPVGEKDIRLFMARYHEISAHTRLLMCAPELVATCLDKSTMSALVDQLGIPQSRYATTVDCQSLFAAADAIGYPCVVKLADSEFLLHGDKARIYDNAEMLRKDFPVWPVHDKPLIVQSYVAGERLNLYFFASNGQISSLGQVLALRTDRLDGTGLSVSGVTVAPDVVLVRYCQTIVRYLKYTGVGCMQFLVDEANRKTSFLENNPRLGAGCVLPYLAGLDLPRIMLEFDSQDAIVPNMPDYPCKIGVRYVWTAGDLRGLKRAIRNRELGIPGAISWLLAMAKANLTTRHHLSWDWRDPLPTFVQTGRLFKSMISPVVAKTAAPGN